MPVLKAMSKGARFNSEVPHFCSEGEYSFTI